MKQRGFTLIELLFAIVMIVVIVLTVMTALGTVNGVQQGNTISWGVNGMTEMRCIDGYRFVVGERGQARQVMDELGHGVKCQ